MADQQQGSHRSTLVVGVVKGQQDAVVYQAIRFAKQLDAELVLATVDDTRYTVYKNSDGTTAAFPIDPDSADVITEEFDPVFAEHLKALLESAEVRWSVRALAGEPAHELARLAHDLHADAIVVGTRKRGFRTSAREFFSGSVAVHLAHRQHHPVIVVPLDPIPQGERLPWEEE